MLFLLEDQNLVFAIAIALMMAIAVLEGVGLLIGFGVSQLLDGLLPDWDVSTPDIEDTGTLTKLLGWVKLKEVPALVALVLALTVFGTVGLIVQLIASNTVGFLLPGLIAVIAALFLSMPLIRYFAQVLGQIGFKDETAAVNTSDLIGLVATITVGQASREVPAQARCMDRFNTVHYLMVTVDGDQVVNQGEDILLTERRGPIFKGIVNSSLIRTK